MVRLNIVNDGVVATPLNDEYPIIEVSDKQYNEILEGKLIVVDGKLVKKEES